MSFQDLTIIAAFGAGVISFFSPCIIPVLPGFLAYLGGGAASGHSRWRLLGSTLLFAFGFSLIFILLGTGAQIFGRPLTAHRDLFEKVGGVALILFGVLLGNWIRLPSVFPVQSALKAVRNSGAYLRDFLTGVIFSFAWIPCIGPILGTILFLATGRETAREGGLLLAAFSFGMSLPFFVFALFLPELRARLGRISFLAAIARPFFAGILILLGILLFFGKLGFISGWLVAKLGTGWAQ